MLEKEKEIESISSWIEHVKWIKQHPNKEDSDEFYQKIIDMWEAKLQDLKKKELL